MRFLQGLTPKMSATESGGAPFTAKDGGRDIHDLEVFAATIRLEMMKMFEKRGFGHVGGALTVVDTLAVLYGGAMNIDPKNPQMKERDRVVMSKGHAGPALYTALALKGFFPIEDLMTLNMPKTNFPSHCDRNKTVGIDATTGSLGQGASQACGMALGLKIDEIKANVYLFLGDGECNEGQVWEAAMFAAQHKLNNLVVFVDANGKQLDGTTEEVMNMGDFALKFEQFGFYAQTVNGASVKEILDAVNNAKKQTEKPSCIVLKGIKGSGVSAIEGIEYNHHIVVDKNIA